MNINDSMLFRWTGYGIEKPEFAHLPAPQRKTLSVEPKLNHKQVDTFLGYLHDALNPKRGLRATVYSAECDKVGRTEPATTPQPCLFFTEQAAGTSEDHWRLYGRLGFGFAKRFIFNLGGRPLIYTSGSNDPVVSAVTSLRKAVAAMNGKKAEAAAKHLELLARFIKTTTLPRLPALERVKTKSEGSKTKVIQKAGAKLDETVPNDSFTDHNPIRFMAEREWRLPVLEKHMEHWEEDALKNCWWFKPEVGKELQVVVVPNNHIFSKAHGCSDLRKLMVGKSGIAVQLLSAQTLRKL